MTLGRLARIGFTLLLAAPALHATTYPVTNTLDSGAGSLRQAILNANANSGLDTITFSISGAGVHTITPATPLPTVTDPVLIDGYTQPGSKANTLAVGDDALLLIELSGQTAGGAGFTLSAGASTVRGLVIHGFTPAVIIDTAGGNVLSGNFIGTDPTGQIAMANAGFGAISIVTPNNVIGGPAAADRNVISGSNSSFAILLSGAAASGNIVQSNYVGTNSSGTAALANAGVGVGAFGSPGATIGGLPATPGTPPGNVISGNSGAGVELSGASGTGNVVSGNLIGTNAAGSAALGNFAGIAIGTNGDASNNQIGGTAVGARNVISGNATYGISLSSGSGGSFSNTIQGNFIGPDATGTIALSPNQMGIFFGGADHNTVGGAAPGAGNLISGNGSRSTTTPGIFVVGPGNVILGNRIGTQVDGVTPLGNPSGGIRIGEVSETIVGGIAPGEGNVIAFNGNPVDRISGGVMVGALGGSGNTIRGNSIHDNMGNLGLGIDLGSDGITANDDGDADAGPNGLQNFPLITSVVAGASTTTIHGVLQSVATTAFDVDFYANPSCSSHPQEFLQASAYIGTAPVTTDGTGNASFTAVLPVAIQAGSRISATATDPAGSTSELSQRIVFSSNPRSGPSSGGTTLHLTGMLFVAGATAAVGGTPASGVVVHDSSSLDLTAPARPAGTINDITITLPGGGSGTLPFAYVSDFLDAPATLPAYPFITKLVSNAITAGCGSGSYCPGSDVTRSQMAVFLLRSRFGLCYVPPPATGTVFSDVPIGSFAAAWIEALAAAQITGGCGGGNYCPTSPVTRGQMAVFLLRTLEGPTYLPPACAAATFGDVPCASGFSPWIYELVARNITAGCGNGNYCPNDSATRGQMAVFLSTTFSLP